MKFKKNEKVNLNENETLKIIDFLGCGGQGEVYLTDYNGKQYALKVYKDNVNADFRYNLKNNIERGSP